MAEQFPKNYKCPHCGSDKPLVVAAWRAIWNEEAPPPGGFEELTIGLKNPKALIPRGIRCWWDLCSVCGLKYCFRVDLVQGHPQPITPTTPQRSNN